MSAEDKKLIVVFFVIVVLGLLGMFGLAVLMGGNP